MEGLMINWDKVEFVQRVQDYINKNIDEENIDLDSLYSSIGYSSRHANRIFKELAQKTILEYVRELRIIKSVERLLNEPNSILNIVLDTNLKSHEGYTRAFAKKFGVTPTKYRKEKIPIPIFTPYPIKHYYSYILNREISKMSKNIDPLLYMITVVNRPKKN